MVAEDKKRYSEVADSTVASLVGSSGTDIATQGRLEQRFTLENVTEELRERLHLWYKMPRQSLDLLILPL